MPDFRKFKICDPLYSYIHLSEGEKTLINHPAFQRLRSVRQLGFSEQAFPSGTHNRFSHSLGVCHLASEAFDSIFSKNKSLLSESKKQSFKTTIRISALLHDIGHGPLSHSSEALLPPLKTMGLNSFLNSSSKRLARHEDYSLKIIMDKEEGLNKVLQMSGVDPLAVAQLLHPDFSLGKGIFVEKGLDFLPLLRQIISSDFDVDRMDYLYRDSLFCGVKYGWIDFMWLISHFDCHIEGERVFLSVGKEGLYTLESLLLGRQHMRLIVYFHHKPAIYNQMLKKYIEDCQWRLPVSLSDYLSWTDEKLFQKLKSDSSNIWARRIITQKAYLRLYEEVRSKYSGEQVKNIEFLKERLKTMEIDFIDINSEEHSIKPKKPVAGQDIFLKNKALRHAIPFREAPGLLTFPPRKIQRLYVDPEKFAKAQSLLKKLPPSFL